MRQSVPWPAVWVIALALLMALPGGNLPLHSAANTAPPTTPSLQGGTSDPPSPAVSVGLALSSDPIDLSSDFWGTTISARANLLRGEGPLVNATPTQIVLWPGAGAGDAYNPLSDRIFAKTESGGHQWIVPPTNETQFVSWCKSIHCTAIFEVPGEINNASIAARIVRYTEDTLDFEPAYWEIGNEPELWKTFNIPWSDWVSNSRISMVTPYQYAILVQNYTIAMRNVDPHIRIIGIGSTGGRQNGAWPVTDWLFNTTLIDGPNISAVSFHSYPSAAAAATTLEWYYASNVPGAADDLIDGVRTDEGAVSAACNASRNVTFRESGCQQLQMFVTEYASGLSHKVSQWSSGFAGALALAAQLTEGMDLNVSNMDLFGGILDTSNSWISLTGHVRPDYTLYTDILSHLGPQAFPVELTAPAPYDGSNTSLGDNLYAIATRDASDSGRSDLLVVNVNRTTGVTFAPSLPGIHNAATPTEVLEWSGVVSDPNYFAPTTVTPQTSAPVAEFFPGGIPSTWTLPAQSVVLIEAYPGGGAPVTFTASGFPSRSPIPRWFLDIGGHVEEANGTSNLTAFLPEGSVNVTGVPIPLPLGGQELVPKERLEPFLASTVTVGSHPANVAVDFVTQWALNVTASPGGRVTATPSWVNASTPLTIRASLSFDRPGDYRFFEWVGFGAGSYNGTDPVATIDPTGWITEKALFTQLFPVTITENGLPPGTPWSIEAQSNANLTANESSAVDQASSITDAISLEETNGTHAYTVPNVPGYRSLPTNSSFTVSASPTAVSVTFVLLTPAPPEFTVSFAETGLPSGTRWSVTVRNVTETASLATIPFAEANGSYGYQVTSPPGYHASPPAFGFFVDGGALTIVVDFLPVRFQAVWEETGLGPNLSWEVLLNGTAVPSSGSWVTAELPNGTYHFVIPDVDDYVPLVRSGSFTIAGSGVVVAIPFPRVTYSITFLVAGLPNGALWYLRLANASVGSTDPELAFAEPNGSYTFNVTGPAGYAVSPSHGTIAVDAQSLTIRLNLTATGPPPTPPTWSLALPALIAAGLIASVGAGTLSWVRARRRRRQGSGL